MLNAYFLRRKIAYDLERISSQSVLPLLGMLGIFPARSVSSDVVESNLFESGCFGLGGILSFFFQPLPFHLLIPTGKRIDA